MSDQGRITFDVVAVGSAADGGPPGCSASELMGDMVYGAGVISVLPCVPPSSVLGQLAPAV
jgi:hypothetical protein